MLNVALLRLRLPPRAALSRLPLGRLALMTSVWGCPALRPPMSGAACYSNVKRTVTLSDPSRVVLAWSFSRIPTVAVFTPDPAGASLAIRMR